MRLIPAEQAFWGLAYNADHVWINFPSTRIIFPPPRRAYLQLPFPGRFRNDRGIEHEVHTGIYDLCHHGLVGPGSVLALPRDGMMVLRLVW